jgi:outer membrane receptor protein involved in Fe transport
MSHFIPLGNSLTNIIKKVTLISFFGSTVSFKVDATEIEKIQVTHARSTISVDDNLTADNTFIELNEYMESQNSLADILSLSPGLSLTGQGGIFQSYNIRGFSRARIKTEVNGIPIITDRRAGNSLSFLPTSLIENIEIKKGPNSTLYGSGAMGGVISLSTLNFDESSLNVLVKPQDDTLQTFLKVSHENLSATLLQRKANKAHSPNNNDDKSTLLNTKHEQFHANIAANFSWQDINILALTMLTQGRDIGKSSAEFPENKITLYPEDKHWLSSIQLHLKERWRLSLFQHNQHWESDISSFDNEIKQTLSRRNAVTYDAQTLGAVGTILLRNTVIGGEWINRNNINISEREFNQENALSWKKNKIDGEENTFGIFANHSWEFNSLIIKSGVRYDWQKVVNHPVLNNSQSKVEDDFVSFSISSQFPYSATTNINIAVANAFRFPTISELFFSGETPRGNIQGNPLLLPEKSIGLQFDLNYQIFNNVRWLTSAYYYQVDNYIERYKLASNNAIRSYRNNAEVIIKGVELKADWQTTDSLNMLLSYQKQWAKDIENNTVDDALPEELNWRMNWFPSAIKGLNVENHLSYQFKKTTFGPSEQALTAEWKWNINVNYKMSEQHNLNIAFINLTNNEYFTSADEDAPFHPERSIAFTWQWKFD